jgi:hypothetical protein
MSRVRDILGRGTGTMIVVSAALSPSPKCPIKQIKVGTDEKFSALRITKRKY